MTEPENEGVEGSFEEGTAKDLDWAEALVEEALLAGAPDAEVYLKMSTTAGILLSPGFTTLTGGSERGVALRVFDGRGNFGHAFSSWVEGGRRREMVRSALASLRASEQESTGTTFPASRFEGDILEPQGIRDPKVTLWSLCKKREMVEAALREASWGRPEGTMAAYRDGISRMVLANSRGFRAGYLRTLSLVTLTRSGDGGPTLQAERVSPGPDPGEVMEMAGGLARLQTAGGDEEVEWNELLVESAAAVGIFRHLLPELIEDSTEVQEPGESGFRRIASEAVTVVDDGLLPGGVASAPFDGEGVPTGRLTLVKAGVRIDRVRAQRTGEVGRPGTTVRASYRDLPSPGGTNLFIAPGNRPVGELLGSLDSGFLLAALEGDVREAGSGSGGSRWRGMGWQVRGGRQVGPCRRIVFRAEPSDLLEGILEVSDRIRFSLRQGVALGAPDLLIRRRR